MEKRVLVKPNAFLMGKTTCPICATKKTGKARICRDCYRQLGMQAANVVEAIKAADQAATEGHKAATAGNVARNTVLGPILVDFNFNVKGRWNKGGNGIQPYMSFSKSVLGGSVNCFAFGFGHEDMGNHHTCLVEVKKKATPVGGVHYIRLQKVPAAIRSAVRFLITEKPPELIPAMPQLQPYQVLDLLHVGTSKERLLEYWISFKPVDQFYVL